MIDPRSLQDAALAPFDPAWVDYDFDEGEPLVLEKTRVGPTDIEVLRQVPIAADNCVFSGCDLSLMSFHGVKNSLFVSSKMRGTRFDKYVRNVVLHSCQLTECLFRMMKMRDVVFNHSKLQQCDFYGSDLGQISFPSTEFAGVGFDRCEIEHIDLTEATQLLIGDPRTLRGAAICETQVPLIATRLAELVGIEVHDC